MHKVQLELWGISHQRYLEIQLCLCIKCLLLNQNYAEFLGEYYDDPPFYVVCQMPLSNKGVGFVGVLGLKVGV